MHGEGGTHALWLVALLGKLQVFAEHRAVIRMGTVFDNLFGTAQWAFATEIGNSLFGNDDIHIVLGTVHVTAHRNNGRDATVLGGTLRGEDYSNPLDVAKDSLAHEEAVSASIRSIFKLAREEGDLETEVFLQWYLTEQVEEEVNARDNVAGFEKAKDCDGLLYMFDAHLADR